MIAARNGGNIDDCQLSDEDRERGVDINDLIVAKKVDGTIYR